MHFSLNIISTPHMPNVRCFDDVAMPIYYALRRLGYNVEIRHNSFNSSSVNICLGANYDPSGQWVKFEKDVIILNLEQLSAAGYPWLKNDEYFNLLKKHRVWDFSQANIKFLAARSIKAEFFQLGYVPEMTRLRTGLTENYDVLFYGAITPRRHDILKRLSSSGLKVNCLTKAYGRERDKAICGAKLFLNVHHSRPASLEIVRLAYVLANSRAVVSELNDDTDHYRQIAGSCSFVPYEALFDEVHRLLDDDEARQRQARQGFDIFSSISLPSSLESLVGRRQAFGLGEKLHDQVPDELNIGSGNDFWHKALNIDTDPTAQADLCIDFGRGIDWEASFQSQRFGELCFKNIRFKRISAFNVLEYITDQGCFMKNMLHLLEDGGELRLRLPYYLASQSPGTRAYSERSWQGACSELLPRAGETALRLESLQFILSDYGRVLKAKGYSMDKIKLRPGAVESLFICLRKTALGLAPQNNEELRTRSFYLGPVVEWQTDFQVPDNESLTRQEILPSAMSMRLRLIGLFFKNIRYQFNSRYSKNKGRYQDKLFKLNEEINRIKKLLSLFNL